MGEEEEESMKIAERGNLTDGRRTDGPTGISLATQIGNGGTNERTSKSAVSERILRLVPN